MVSYDPNLPYINIDKNRIIQVLINVLDNAFKFVGENAKVTFTATYNNNYIIIVIEDNGCGISKEELPRVKEKFYKGKSSKSQNGIGLSICDEIISQHNGILQIDSELNVGTKVTICLPLEN
jgi:signal transduction histidine kinase